MTDPPEPIARNALIASLLICSGVGWLTLGSAPSAPAAPQVPAQALRAADAANAPGKPGQAAPSPEAAQARAAPAAGAQAAGDTPEEGETAGAEAPAASGAASAAPKVAAAKPAPTVPRRAPLGLTQQQLAAGLNECAMPDPGPGYFAPPRPTWKGMMYLPARGGHTADGGFDVVLHFHGGQSVRKALVGNARGVAFIAIDIGIGSGPYANAFAGTPALFDEVRHNIEKALRAHSNREDAHIRHFALSAWSAGYGAVNAILRQAGDGVADGVILLDGFHAGYLEGSGYKIDERGVEPLVNFARVATKGERFFYFSHSQVGTEGYASTHEMADYLLKELGLRRTAAPPEDDPFALTGYVDRRGFHLRSFGGIGERAHCDHVRHGGEAVRLLEERWGTPSAEPAAPSKAPAAP